MADNNSNGGNLAVIATTIESAKTRFLQATGGDLTPFLRENEFAMQIMRRSSFVADVARRNPDSLRDALVQSAVTGLSLNPVQGHAYLVPRDGMVCFDPSYRGLRDTAVADGVIRWCRADVIHANDTFEIEEDNAGNRMISHRYDAMAPAKERGAIRGGYCCWEDANGHRDCITETLDELYASHRSRSVAWTKGGGGIWKTDEAEAIRKSLVKRAHKSWPRIPGSTGRFDAAVAAAISADDQIVEAVEVTVDAEQAAKLEQAAGDNAHKWLEFYQRASFAEMTPANASDMMRRIEATAKRKALEAEKDGGKAAKAVAVEAPDGDEDVDAIWQQIDDISADLAGGDMGAASAIVKSTRAALKLPLGELTAKEVASLRDALRTQVG
jgi:recombinational DNA repair protein RecT